MIQNPYFGPVNAPGDFDFTNASQDLELNRNPWVGSCVLPLSQVFWLVSLIYMH